MIAASRSTRALMAWGSAASQLASRPAGSEASGAELSAFGERQVVEALGVGAQLGRGAGQRLGHPRAEGRLERGQRLVPDPGPGVSRKSALCGSCQGTRPSVGAGRGGGAAAHGRAAACGNGRAGRASRPATGRPTRGPARAGRSPPGRRGCGRAGPRRRQCAAAASSRAAYRAVRAAASGPAAVAGGGPSRRRSAPGRARAGPAGRRLRPARSAEPGCNP